MNHYDITFLVAIIPILGFIVVSVALAFYIIDRKKSWEGYKGKKIPIGLLIPKDFQFENYYIHMPIIEIIEDWDRNSEKNLLLIGPSGVGKSRAVVEFFKVKRQREKVFVLDEPDILEKRAPLFTRKGYIVLDDLHRFQPYSLSKVLCEKRFKIIATMKELCSSDESYSPLQWKHVYVKKWTKDKGEELAKHLKKELNMKHFNGTPLSVIAPTAQMTRLYDRANSKQKTALRTLKTAKTCLECFVDVQLILEIADSEISRQDVESVLSRWCLRKDEMFILRDEFDKAIPSDFSLEDCENIFNKLYNAKRKHFFRYYFHLGVVYNKYKKDDFALSCWENFIKFKPDKHEVWANKGTSLDNLGNPEEALKAFDKAIELNPNHYNTWYNKGVTLMNMDKYEEALKAFDKAIELNPKHEDSWNNKGRTLSELGKHREALKAIVRAIELNPKSENAWNNKGIILTNLGQIKEALNVYDKAIELNPKSENAWNNKGITLVSLGQIKEALNVYDKAIELNPKSEKTLYNKAWCHALKGDVNMAVDLLEKVLIVNPSSYCKKAAENPSFNSIRAEPEFVNLMENYCED